MAVVVAGSLGSGLLAGKTGQGCPLKPKPGLSGAPARISQRQRLRIPRRGELHELLWKEARGHAAGQDGPSCDCAAGYVARAVKHAHCVRGNGILSHHWPTLAPGVSLLPGPAGTECGPEGCCCLGSDWAFSGEKLGFIVRFHKVKFPTLKLARNASLGWGTPALHHKYGSKSLSIQANRVVPESMTTAAAPRRAPYLKNWDKSVYRNRIRLETTAHPTTWRASTVQK
jgi:hypothetical protein